MPSERLLERQREAAERLRREVMGLDGSLSHPYFRPLAEVGRSYRREVDPGELVARAARAGLVFVSDFHALPGNARFAARLLEALQARGCRPQLGVEFVFSRQQRLLDRRQRGLLDDEAFLRRMHYRDEWGYPWEGYRELLDTARRLEAPVVALDLPPRRGFDGLRRRDAHAARHIAARLRREPDRALLVLFGESHLTASHLPARTAEELARAGLAREPLVVFQNPDELYWRRVAERKPLDRPLEIDATTVAVFDGTPLEKYEAYRQVVERWESDLPQDDEIDLTPAVHHLVDALASWIGVRPTRRRLRHRAGWSELLVDAYPEVYAGPEAAELLRPILIEHGRSEAEIGEAQARLTTRGALYEPRSNTMFLRRYLPGPAAGEAARFLRAALTGRLFAATDDFQRDPAQATWGAAYTESLAQLGARLVDPAWDPLAAAAGHPTGGAAQARVGSRARALLDAHRRLEERHGACPDAPMLDALRASRELRRAVARELGARLAARHVERLRRGALDRRELRRLFVRKLRPARAAEEVLALLRD